jgi:uridine kinase
MTLIAIDGPAGAGKTTLAAKLQLDLSKEKSLTVIHMDDLYAGWENPLSVDLTKILAKIVEAFSACLQHTVPIYNWANKSFDSSLTYEPTDILIIEGVGAGQKVVRDAGATLYWLDIEPEIGLARVLKRDGFEIETQMRQWQIDQEKHFESDATRTFADYLLTS